MPEEIFYERPYLYPKQLEAIFTEKRYAVVEASTKSGKTVACLVSIFEHALRPNGRAHYWWLAPTSLQARIAFGRLKEWIPSQLYTANESDGSITLPNVAVIWFRWTNEERQWEEISTKVPTA